MPQALLRDAQKEIEAAKVLRAQIADLAQGDEDFIRDTLEGETDLDTLVGKLAADDAFDGANIAAIAELKKQLSARADRIERRVDLRRAAMQSALEVSGRKTFETPAGTVTLKNVASKLMVSNEAEIPTSWFTPQAPTLNRTALTKHLKDRAKQLLEIAEGKEIPSDQLILAVPGAQLSNGSQTIQIKV